jgi:hypothetical protein
MQLFATVSAALSAGIFAAGTAGDPRLRIFCNTGNNSFDHTPFCGAGIGVPLRVARWLQRTSVGVPHTEYANDYEHDHATPFSL